MQDTKEDRLEKAIKDRESGMTLLAASKNNDVPYTTLQRHTTKPFVLEKGRQTYLTMEMEQKLVTTAKYMASNGMGMSKTKFLKLALQHINFIRGAAPPLTHLSNEWWEGMKSRHKNFGAWYPKGRNIKKRIEAEKDPENVLSFYNKFQKYNKKHNYAPHQVWNADETGSAQKERASHIVGNRTQRDLNGRTSSLSLHMTMLACINAAGKYFPPLFIMKGTKVDRFVFYEAMDGTMIATSNSAYINEAIFNGWLIRFIGFIREETDLPQLLIIDNCTSHIRASTILLAKLNNIDLLALPPNLTHILQPLDVCMFRSFKALIRSRLSDTLCFYNTRSLNAGQFIGMCCRIVEETFTTDKIKFAFKAIGLFPFDPDRALERIKRYAPVEEVIVPVTRRSRESKKIAEQKAYINLLKKELAHVYCNAYIALEEKIAPPRRQKLVKTTLAQVLTAPDLEQCIISAAEAEEKANKKKKRKAVSESKKRSKKKRKVAC
jgi:hypothetical protein